MEMISVVVRRFRTEAGLTQEQLAEEMNTSSVYISQIETGARSPSRKWLQRFAAAINVSLAELWRNIYGDREVDEATIAQIVAAYPALAAVFEYARKSGDRGALAELARFAQLLIAEIEGDGRGQRGRTSAEDPE